MKNYKNKNAFTLVELLVAVSIMSIIMILAIPSIGAIQERNSLRRYKNYGETVISSAKLYTDSNSIDMFGYEKDGCFDVTFEKLVEKNLVKDIDYKDVTCADSSSKRTFVRVKKLDGVYKYQLSMYCADSKGKKAYSDLIADKEPICAGEKSYMGPEIIVSPEKTNGFDKDKDYKVGITIQDDDGLLENNEVDYAWCKKSDCSDVTKYTRLRFENKREAKKASRKIKRPDEDGEYYFIVKSVVVVDVFNHSTSKTIIKGPYKLDKTPPKCKSSGGRDSWTGGNTTQTIKGECSDNYSGCTEETKIVKQEFTDDEESIKSPGTVYDNAGNSTKCDDQKVKVDKTKPTCDVSGGRTSWAGSNSAQTITGKCKDNLSGCEKDTYEQTFSTSTGTIKFESPGTAKDKSGNETPCGNVQVMVDVTPPTCSPAKTNTGTTLGVTITYTCSDTGGSTLSACGSNATSPFTISKIKATPSPAYTAKDVAGNSTPCTVTVTSQTQWKKKTRSVKDCYDERCGTEKCNCTSKCVEWGCFNGSGALQYKTTYDCTGQCTFSYVKCTSTTESCGTCASYCGYNSSICGYTGWTETKWRTSKYTCSDSNTCQVETQVVYN